MLVNELMYRRAPGIYRFKVSLLLLLQAGFASLWWCSQCFERVCTTADVL